MEKAASADNAKQINTDNVYVLRILAIFLIINAHMAALYPSRALAFGGYPGDSIFYLISGYGLALSFSRRPLGTAEWLNKRFLKVIIPLVFLFGIANIGSLKGFTSSLMGDLVPHTTEQLKHFMPVLWILYILFLPVYKLKNRNQGILLSILLFVSLGIFLWQTHFLQTPPPNFASHGVFFALNGLICFTLGVFLNGIRLGPILSGKTAKVLLLALILLTQIFHKMIGMFVPVLSFFEFYLSIIFVAALFLLFLSMRQKVLPGASLPIKEIAASSLAVYIVHFKFIALARALGIMFPLNIIFVLVNSFLWAYSAAKLTSVISGTLLNKIQLKQAGAPQTP